MQTNVLTYPRQSDRNEPASRLVTFVNQCDVSVRRTFQQRMRFSLSVGFLRILKKK